RFFVMESRCCALCGSYGDPLSLYTLHCRLVQPRHPPSTLFPYTTLFRSFPTINITLHFHNTRGMGLANVLEGIRAGINRFDSSLGGLGGCPFAPGATGNICTEDLVHMLYFMGYKMTVNLDKLVNVAKYLQEIIP